MTKEELKQEAEESFEQYKVTDEDYVVSPYSDDMGEKMLMYNDEYYAEETYLRFYKQGYLAGAEPREKQIEELERKLEQTEKDLADYQFNYLTIKELEKENAELLEKLKNQKADYETYYKSCYNAQKKTEKQLTKAKEIIREFVEWATWQGSNCPSFKSIQDKAEQFISEVEK